MSTIGTVEEVAAVIGQLAEDVSTFAPPPVGAIAALLGEGATAVAGIIKALEGGATPESLVHAIEVAVSAASAAEMKRELGP